MAYWRPPQNYDQGYNAYGYGDGSATSQSYGGGYGYDGGYGGSHSQGYGGGGGSYANAGSYGGGANYGGDASYGGDWNNGVGWNNGGGGYGSGSYGGGRSHRGGGGGYGGHRRHDDNRHDDSRRKRNFRDQQGSKTRPSTRQTKPSAEYYFENGFRKVYPYFFTFYTTAQKRWEDRAVLDIFTEEYPSNTEDNYKKAIEKGTILVNDQRIPLDYVVKSGDTVSSKAHRHEDPVLDLPIQIVHEDNDMLVVNKPPGIPCNPSGRFKANAISSVLQHDLNLQYLKNMYHLDWQCSGLMVFGKNSRKFDTLDHQVHQGMVHKQFMARVVGEFPLGKITVDNPQESVTHKLSMWRISSNGKPTKTIFERISYNGKSSVVKCIPEVGRTSHQIRVHLQYMGHPIINDRIYNSEAWGKNKGKGGVYERPMEEVIEELSKVSKISSVGEWLDDENPILTQKAAKEAADQEREEESARQEAQALKEAKAKAEKEAQEAIEKQQQLEAAGESGDEKMAEGETEGEGEKETEIKTVAASEETKSEEEPAEVETTDTEKTNAKADEEKADGGKMDDDKADVEKIDDDKADGDKIDDDKADEVKTGDTQADGENKEDDEVTAMDTSESSEPQAKRVKTDDETEDEKKADVKEDDDSLKLTYARYKTRGQIFVVKHKPFNIDKWSPAENCVECLKTYVDPTPESLVLFLHAQMFESPDWQYYSKLPDWASEDWTGPEED